MTHTGVNLVKEFKKLENDFHKGEKVNHEDKNARPATLIISNSKLFGNNTKHATTNGTDVKPSK